MNFATGSAITLPFTVSVSGQSPAELKNRPISAFIYSKKGSTIERTLMSVVIRDVGATSIGSTVFGELRVKPEENNLSVGSYFAVIALELDGTIKELIRLPFDISEENLPYKVFFADKQYLSTEEQMTLLGSVLPSGILKGCEVIKQNAGVVVQPGMIRTEDGHIAALVATSKELRFENLDNLNAKRLDAVTLRYGGAYDTPELIVLKGEEHFTAPIPSPIPENYTVLAYVELTETGVTRITSTANHFLGTYMAGVKPMESPDGNRSDFSFPVDMQQDNIVVKVDGIPQILGEDYLLNRDNLGQTVVSFIAEVPHPGQLVTISGEVNHRTAYSYNWVYAVKAEEEVSSWVGSLENPTYRWMAKDYAYGTVSSSSGVSVDMEFEVADRYILNYNREEGYYLQTDYGSLGIADASKASFDSSENLAIAFEGKTLYGNNIYPDQSIYNLFTIGKFSVILIYYETGPVLRLSFNPVGMVTRVIDLRVDTGDLKVLINLTKTRMTLKVGNSASSLEISNVQGYGETLMLGDVTKSGKGLPMRIKGLAVFDRNI